MTDLNSGHSSNAMLVKCVLCYSSMMDGKWFIRLVDGIIVLGMDFFWKQFFLLILKLLGFFFGKICGWCYVG